MSYAVTGALTRHCRTRDRGFQGHTRARGGPHFDRSDAEQAFVALAGEDRIVFDQHLAYVEEENIKHRRKAARP
jgi:hypothetical protein